MKTLLITILALILSISCLANWQLNTKNTYRIDYDNAGNIYTLGGSIYNDSATVTWSWGTWDTTVTQYGIFTEYSITKYSPNGTLLWTDTIASSDYFNTPGFPWPFKGYLGDMSINRRTGDVYVAIGAIPDGVQYPSCAVVPQIRQYDTNGVLNSVASDNCDHIEAWNVVFDETTNKVVVSGGQPNIPEGSNISVFNTSPLSLYGSINLIGATEGAHDTYLLAVDCATGIYIGYSGTYWGLKTNFYNNRLVKSYLPNLSNIDYWVALPYSNTEAHSVQYVVESGTNHYNGIAIGTNYFFTTDGSKVDRYSKATGNNHISVNLSSTEWTSGGIDANAGDSVFVVDGNKIRIFNSALSLLQTINLPDTAYDLKVGNNRIYVCGKKFVSVVDFQLKKGCSNLTVPVELLEFKGSIYYGKSILRWTTISEINNNFYTILKSRDGITWDTLGSIPGHINSVDINKYIFIDNNPFLGINYYKLSQTDYDGNTEYLKMIAIYNRTHIEDELFYNIIGQRIK